MEFKNDTKIAASKIKGIIFIKILEKLSTQNDF